MRRLQVALCVAAVAFLAISTAQAGVLPTVQDHKYEASLDGFAHGVVEDPDGSLGTTGISGDEYIRSETLTKIDSPLKDQGEVPYKAYPFVVGFDALGSPYKDKNNSGVLAMITTGLKVIAYDDTADGGLTYNRLTTPAQILGQFAAGFTNGDILHFGDANPQEGGDAGDPRGWFYYKDGVTESDFGPGAGSAWSAGSDVHSTGVNYDLFTDGGTGNTIGDEAASTLVLKTAFQDISGLRVDGTPMAAPPGTLISNVFDIYASRRPIFLMDVIGGAEAWTVQEDAMKVTLEVDANLATPQWEPGGGTVERIDDIISALAAQPWPPTPGPVYDTEWTSLSDPAEWIAQIPEPGTLAIWGVLSVLGLALFGRRRGR